MHKWCVFIMAITVGTGAGVNGAEQARALDLGFEQAGWEVQADAPWWGLVDIRNMLNLFHPLSLSEANKAAGATREVTIPDDWKPPFALRFYCADDYFADPNTKPGTLGTECFFGHRFKQVLVDDAVVWESDVTDENLHGSPTIFTVDLTPHVTPGEAFRLTLRVIDRVPTTERNERDVWFIGGTWYSSGDGKTEEPPRFHTAVWFADAVVGEEAAVAAAPPGQRPNERIVAARQAKLRRVSPRGSGALPVTLQLVSPTTIPEPGAPVTCGIPMPPGALKRADRVKLTGPSGRDLPLQTEPTGYWPDGSVRWLLLHTIAPAGATPGASFRLQARNSAAPAKSQLRLTESAAAATVDTGNIVVSLGADPAQLLDGVCLAGSQDPAIGPLTARMSIRQGEALVPVTATWQDLKIIERGPVRACAELHGTLDTPTGNIGRFVFRVYAYAGLPTLQVQYRIFDDVKPEPYAGTIDDAPLQVTDLALVAALPGQVASTTVGGDGGAALSAQSIVQGAADKFESPAGEGKKAAGWIAAATDRAAVHATVWRLAAQFPKSLAVGPEGLTIGLFTPSAATPDYHPRFGEAKRHDITLSFAPQGGSDGTNTTLGQLSQQPPRLFDRAWFCNSGAINVLDPDTPEHFPQLNQWMADKYGDASSARVTGYFGMRNFGDMPYNATQWLNGYWAMVQGALNWGLVSGDEQWVQRGFEIARHIADVDSVHLPEAHPDWSAWHGVTCALGIDHSVHGGNALWPAFQIGESLLLHYWMTGDPDSRDAGLANADYLIRSSAGVGSSEARSQARPMLTLLRAWQVTGKNEYLEGARRYLDLKYQREHVVEWRRGAYIQPTYANWRCVSAGLDSMYAHDIYEYYRLTADADAAQMVVAIADSVYAESMLPQEEAIGSFIFYPRYSRSSWYYTQMAMLFFMAYDLTEDARFLRAGRAAWDRYLLCQDGNGNPMYQPFHNFGWLDPECGGWLQEYEEVPTQPYTIVGQTPVPDPANYQ